VQTGRGQPSPGSWASTAVRGYIGLPASCEGRGLHLAKMTHPSLVNAGLWRLAVQELVAVRFRFPLRREQGICFLPSGSSVRGGKRGMAGVLNASAGLCQMSSPQGPSKAPGERGACSRAPHQGDAPPAGAEGTSLRVGDRPGYSRYLGAVGALYARHCAGSIVLRGRELASYPVILGRVHAGPLAVRNGIRFRAPLDCAAVPGQGSSPDWPGEGQNSDDE
jgi:hypothetical protein